MEKSLFKFVFYLKFVHKSIWCPLIKNTERVCFAWSKNVKINLFMREKNKKASKELRRAERQMNYHVVRH